MSDARRQGLSEAVKHGVMWVLAERGVVQVISLAGGVLLARLLTPRDFGVMALSFVVTGLSSRLLHMGLGMALVQRETIRPDHVSTMFVMALAVNATLGLAVWLVAPYAGAYFETPLVGEVLRLMAFTFVIRAFGVCPTALLRRRMDFRSRTVGSVIDSVVKVGAAVGLAAAGHGVWSLAYGELSGAVAEKVYLVLASGWRPGLRVTRAATGDLLGFGIGLSLKSSVAFLAERIDNVIVGKWLGPAALGLYEKAYNLMDMPVREMGARMNTVFFPAFSRLQADHARLRAAYRKTVLSLALLAYPLFAALAVVAPEFIRLVYGAQWVPAIVPFQILCLAGPPRVLTHVTGSLVNATGAVASEVKARGVALVLLVGAVALGARWGITGVAAGVTLVNFLTLGMVLAVAHRRMGLGVRDVLHPQVVPLAGTLALVAASLAVRRIAMEGWHLPAPLTASLCLLTGAAAYAGVLYVRRDGAVAALLAELGADVRRVVTGFGRAARPRPGRGSARAAG